MDGEAQPQTPVIELDLSRIPVKPTGAKEVRELEIALIIATMFRPDVFKEILDPKEFTTWLDSLAVAAGALAREKAGYPVSRIAEELGRSESTIRNHLQGKTKAGKLVRETYEQLVRGKIKIVAIGQQLGALPSQDELEKLRMEVEELKGKVGKLKESIKEAVNHLDKAREALARALEEH